MPAQTDFPALEFQRTDEALVTQFFVALEFGAGELKAGLSRALGCRRTDPYQLEIGGLQLRQGLPLARPLTHLDAAGDQFSTHPKAQFRLDARAHLGGELLTCPGRICRQGQSLDRSHRLRCGLRLASRHQTGGCAQDLQARQDRPRRAGRQTSGRACTWWTLPDFALTVSSCWREGKKGDS